MVEVCLRKFGCTFTEPTWREIRTIEVIVGCLMRDAFHSAAAPGKPHVVAFMLPYVYVTCFFVGSSNSPVVTPGIYDRQNATVDD